MNNSTTKKCRVCKQEIDILLFAKNKKTKTGYDTICAECNRIKAAKYRRANPEKIRQDKKEWAKKHSNRHKGRKRDNKKDTARRKVHRAIRSGKIPPPSAFTCDYDGCTKKAEQYHHYAGYSEENYFKVQPLCIEHHGVVHRIYDF